jgi:hypothetical protein
MNIIFLDIDGVLNCQDYYTSDRFDRENSTYPLSEIDPFRIELLNYIIENTGAKVVISSAWRHNRTIDEMRNIMNECGFKGEIIDFTPSSSCGMCLRGNEIHKWIQDNDNMLGKKYHQFRSYVIIDDDSDMLYWQKENFFHCDSHSGLTPNMAYKIVNFFKSFEL